MNGVVVLASVKRSTAEVRHPCGRVFRHLDYVDAQNSINDAPRFEDLNGRSLLFF